MLVSCRVGKSPFLETCLVTITNVMTCRELVCWCVGNVTTPRVTEDDIHRQHTSFVLASHMSCHGFLPTRDQDWLPVMVSATLKMSSKIRLWHVSGWHVAKMLPTFPTKNNGWQYIVYMGTFIDLLMYGITVLVSKHPLMLLCECVHGIMVTILITNYINKYLTSFLLLGGSASIYTVGLVPFGRWVLFHFVQLGLIVGLPRWV